LEQNDLSDKILISSWSIKDSRSPYRPPIDI